MKPDKPELKSDEERYFYAWCEEAVKNGVLRWFTYEPESYLLSEKVTTQVRAKTKTAKMVAKHLMHPHSYRADFAIGSCDRFESFNHGLRCRSEWTYLIDTKGTWMNRGAKQEFSMNQKWLWQVHGLYVNKVVPQKFFKATWCPRLAMFGKSGKQRKAFSGCKLAEEVL